MEWRHRLLEELVYERVRLHVNLAELIEFERDLGESIARALKACGREGLEQQELARRHLDRAWQRLEEEWEAERRRDSEWAECPLCEAPYDCPPRTRTPGDRSTGDRSTDDRLTQSAGGTRWGPGETPWTPG